MPNPLADIVRVLGLPCREHSRVMSRELDGAATIGERIGLRLHYVVCPPCRRLMAHLRWLSRTARGLGRSAARPPLAMPAEVRDRIARRLRA